MSSALKRAKRVLRIESFTRKRDGDSWKLLGYTVNYLEPGR